MKEFFDFFQGWPFGDAGQAKSPNHLMVLSFHGMVFSDKEKSGLLLYGKSLQVRVKEMNEK